MVRPPATQLSILVLVKVGLQQGRPRVYYTQNMIFRYSTY